MPAKVVPNVQAGQLRRRLTLQTPSGILDADTDADTDAKVVWTTFATVWGAVEPLTGTAVGAPNANLQGVVTYLVRIRYIAGVVNGMQIYEASTGLTMDVLAVLDVEEAHRQLHLECVSRRYPPV